MDETFIDNMDNSVGLLATTCTNRHRSGSSDIDENKRKKYRTPGIVQSPKLSVAINFCSLCFMSPEKLEDQLMVT